MSCDTETNSIQAVHRVGEYPIVKDTLLKFAEYYEWAKTKNTKLASTLEWTESGAQKVVSVVEPIASSKLKYVDCMACSQLDKLEQSFPVVLAPTEEVLAKSKSLYDENLKPTVDNVVNKAAQVKGGLDSAIEVSTKAVKAPIETSTAVANYAIDYADTCVDKWLGADEQESVNKQDQKDLLAKVSRLSAKTQRRLYNKALRELKKVSEYSEKSIGQLKAVMNMLEAQKKQRLENIVELRKEFQQIISSIGTSDKVEFSGDDTLNDKLMKTVEFYARNFRIAVYSAGTVVYRHLSKENQDRFDLAVTKTQDLYNKFTGSLDKVNEKVIEESKANIEWVQETLNSSVKSVEKFVSEKLKNSEPAESTAVSDEESDSSNNITNGEIANKQEDSSVNHE